MASFSVEAVVLARKDLGEADRLLTIFSRTYGKQRVVAKGVRRLTSHMSAHVEPGRVSQLLVIERRSLPLVTQATTHQIFLPSAAGLTELQQLFQVLQIVDRLLDDGQRDSRLYDLLRTALQRLGAVQQRWPASASSVVYAFALQALRILGFTLELENCLGCSKPITTPQAYLSVARGGVLHPACAIPGPGVFEFSAANLQTARELARAKLATIEQLPPCPELHRPLAACIEWFSERKLTTFDASISV